MGTVASIRYREGVPRMLQIHEITSAEAASLAPFYEELARCQDEVSTHRKGARPPVPIAQRVAECADDLASGRAHAAIAEDGGTAVAFCKVSVVGARGLVDDLVVMPSYRGRGLGSRLMAWARRALEDAGARDLEPMAVAGDDSADLSVRPLTDEDVPQLLDLARGNPLYYQHLGEEPTLESLAAELRELPPGCPPDRKRCLGFFDWTGAPVAVMDLLRGYPDETYGYIGFFMVAAEHQGRGVGTRIAGAVLDRLRAEGFRRVRLGYVQGNGQSEGFWRSLGFTPTGDAVAHGSCMVVPAELEL